MFQHVYFMSNNLPSILLKANKILRLNPGPNIVIIS